MQFRIVFRGVQATYEFLEKLRSKIEFNNFIYRAIGSAPNLSDIVVYLVTSEGIVQEQTECSPQGYFFIPIYDIVIK